MSEREMEEFCSPSGGEGDHQDPGKANPLKEDALLRR